MTRVTGPDYEVVCNLINKYIHTHTHTHTWVESEKNVEKKGLVQ